ncbi:MAG TPA: diacylglycerol kinase family protein [Candidatus Saccharimonadales bacterium]|nr:diacylglycerol kinase family protein [Candidatus Saccharimonadales bacterium]
MAKPLLVIANQRSGGVTSNIGDLRATLEKYGINHQLKTVKSLPEAIKAAKSADTKRHQAVAVFGGDGTVLSVAKTLSQTNLPVLVLPGGSANSLAVNIEPDLTIDDIVKLYTEGSYIIRHLQLADYNGKPLVLDAHFGLLAESMGQASHGLKRFIGRWAYYIATIRNILGAKPDNYRLEIDGQLVETPGYACFIINHGQLRLLGQPIAPSYRAGSLRLALIRQARLSRILIWYLSKLILRRNRPSVIISRRVDSIRVLSGPNSFYCDDQKVKPTYPANFSVSGQTAAIIVPSYDFNAWRSRLRLAETLYYRSIDHVARRLFGAPTIRYSRVSRHLYLGGQYKAKTAVWFKRWRVTGVVSMREFVPKRLPGVDILHLPTPDHTAPKLEDLQRGVEFIGQRVDRGESVYIHCRMGEGRGPTMAAAYLISAGMRPSDALSHLQRVRPHARPNRQQIEVLEDFAKQSQI